MAGKRAVAGSAPLNGGIGDSSGVGGIGDSSGVADDDQLNGDNDVIDDNIFEDHGEDLANDDIFNALSRQQRKKRKLDAITGKIKEDEKIYKSVLKHSELGQWF